jgi:hypothetical protein
MSKERELLNKAIEMIQIVPLMASIGHAAPDFGSELILEIQELLAQPEQTEQEPVAWMYDHQIEVGYDKYTEVNIIETCARNLESNNCINIRPLYLAQPKREPLSEDNLDVLAVLAEANITDEGIAGYYLGFRDAEKMNGIGGGE